MLSDREKELLLVLADATVGRQDGYLELYRRGVCWVGTSSSHVRRFEGDNLEDAMARAIEALGAADG